MSIRTLPIKKLFNSLTSTTVTVSGGVLTISGLGSFTIANILTGSCFRTCPTACTKGVYTITPVLPTTPCECPYEWMLTVQNRYCSNEGHTDGMTPRSEVYGYNSPNGATPTVSDIIDNIVDEINSNPYSQVTATKTGPVGAYTAMVLTEKDCDSDRGTCGYDVSISGGTVVTTTAHVEAVLKADDQLRKFPIQPGSFGSRPEVALCGAYCVYRFTVKPLTTIESETIDHGYLFKDGQFELWVNSDLTNYVADFEEKMDSTGLACWNND